MKLTDGRRIILTAALSACVAIAASGCSPRTDVPREDHARTESGYGAGPKTPLEIECERELNYLDDLIESCRRNPTVPPATLAEAIELRRTATDLILTEDYELALELIDEAIRLLALPADR